MQHGGWFIPFMLILFLAFALAGWSETTPAISSDAVQWQSYARADVGFTIEVPAEFQAETVGADTVFRYHGSPVLRVLAADVETARTRGLWVTGRMIGQAQVAGRTADVYVYDHQELFTYSHMLAYVLPHGEQQLGIEFRTAGDAPDATGQRILASFRLSR